MRRDTRCIIISIGRGRGRSRSTSLVIFSGSGSGSGWVGLGVFMWKGWLAVTLLGGGGLCFLWVSLSEWV
jgi:hypothetical protein